MVLGMNSFQVGVWLWGLIWGVMDIIGIVFRSHFYFLDCILVMYIVFALSFIVLLITDQ